MGGARWWRPSRLRSAINKANPSSLDRILKVLYCLSDFRIVDIVINKLDYIWLGWTFAPNKCERLKTPFNGRIGGCTPEALHRFYCHSLHFKK